MTQILRIIVADDRKIARDGIRSALSLAPDLIVAAEASSIERALELAQDPSHDAILMDLKWDNDENAGARGICAIRLARPFIWIVALTAYEGLIDDALAAGANRALVKEYRRHKLFSVIREARSYRKVLAEQYRVSLEGMPPGKSEWPRYEKLMTSILTFLLSPHLSNPSPQSSPHSGSKRRDNAFLNNTSHDFWQRVHGLHAANHIVFEYKNTSKTKPKHVDDLAGHLGRRLGRFGAVVARVAPDARVLVRQVYYYGSGEFVPLVMWDEHVLTMLSYKAAGIDPVDVIDSLYSELMLKV